MTSLSPGHHGPQKLVVAHLFFEAPSPVPPLGYTWNDTNTPYVTRHEKMGLVCTKHIPLHYSTNLTFSINYTSSVKRIKISIACCTSCKCFIDNLCLGIKL